MKLKNSSCAARIQRERDHFSYCTAAHPCSLEGTLVKRKTWIEVEPQLTPTGTCYCT
jgi:hypothetical protein